MEVTAVVQYIDWGLGVDRPHGIGSTSVLSLWVITEEERVLRQGVVVRGGEVLIEIHSLVEEWILGDTLALRNLDPHMVKFLHPQQLSQVAIRHLLGILEVIDSAQFELLQLVSEHFESVLESLHFDLTVINGFPDGLDLDVQAQLDRCQLFTHHIKDHLSRDGVQLRVQVHLL